LSWDSPEKFYLPSNQKNRGENGTGKKILGINLNSILDSNSKHVGLDFLNRDNETNQIEETNHKTQEAIPISSSMGLGQLAVSGLDSGLSQIDNGIMRPGEFNAKEKVDNLINKAKLKKTIKTDLKTKKASRVFSGTHTEIFNIDQLNMQIEADPTNYNVSNSDILLSLFELTSNPNYHQIKHTSGKSNRFWSDVSELQSCQFLFDKYKPETLRKYWCKMTEVDDNKKFIQTILDNKTSIDQSGLL